MQSPDDQYGRQITALEKTIQDLRSMVDLLQGKNLEQERLISQNYEKLQKKRTVLVLYSPDPPSKKRKYQGQVQVNGSPSTFTPSRITPSPVCTKTKSRITPNTSKVKLELKNERKITFSDTLLDSSIFERETALNLNPNIWKKFSRSAPRLITYRIKFKINNRIDGRSFYRSFQKRLIQSKVADTKGYMEPKGKILEFDVETTQVLKKSFTHEEILTKSVEIVKIRGVDDKSEPGYIEAVMKLILEKYEDMFGQEVSLNPNTNSSQSLA